MSRRGARPEGTFYFQAWHVDKVVGGESWSNNKDLADYIDQNLSPESKRWLCVKACIPTKAKPSLAIPYSICVKRRAPKLNEEDDGEKRIFYFRDKEFPSLAKRYFLTRLRKTLDFFNAYSEGVDPDSPLANFTEVKSSKQLSQRVHAVIRHMKKDSWGDLMEGLLEGKAMGSEFKASKFIIKRGQDPTKQNPHVLSTEPLQTILLSSGGSVMSASRESLPQMDDASSVNSDDTAATSVSDQSVENAEEEEEGEKEEAEPSSSQEESASVGESSASSSELDVEEIVRSSTSSNDQALVHRSSNRRAMAAGRHHHQQVAYMMSGDSQMAFINIQDPRKLLQSMMMTSKGSFSLPTGMDLLNSPMVVAMAGSPLQSLQADGTMRLFFLSKAKKAKKMMAGGSKKKKRSAGGKDDDDQNEEEEWVVGSVKLSARRPQALEMKKVEEPSVTPTQNFLSLAPEIGQQHLARKVVKEESEKRQIVEIEDEHEDHKGHGHDAKDEMCGPDCFSAHCGKPRRRRTTILEQEKRILHLETRTVRRVVEDVEEDEVSDEKKEKKQPRVKSRRSPSLRSRSSTLTTSTTESSFSSVSKPSTKSSKYQFQRDNWRSEPQPPELFCDVVSGANFLQVEDFEVFSFSAMTHDTLQRYAGFEDSDGINVWAPPSMKVVGVLSWMWDHFNVNPWGRAA